MFLAYSVKVGKEACQVIVFRSWLIMVMMVLLGTQWVIMNMAVRHKIVPYYHQEDNKEQYVFMEVPVHVVVNIGICLRPGTIGASRIE